MDKRQRRWWANDSISESEFVNAIQYLIKERIIVIPDLPESGESSDQAVPEWVKNNAAWWAEGLITDQDFVNGINWLIEKGIIRVRGIFSGSERLHSVRSPGIELGSKIIP